jgi:hypothetical protein
VRKLIGVELLLLDDFALHPLDALETSDIYEVVIEGHHRAATADNWVGKAGAGNGGRVARPRVVAGIGRYPPQTPPGYMRGGRGCRRVARCMSFVAGWPHQPLTQVDNVLDREEDHDAIKDQVP